MGDREGGRIPWAVLGTALIALFGAVKLIRPLGQTFTPLGDVSFIELSVRQAVRGGTALGPYSRFDFHHPGPALFYLLSPFYVLSGDSSRSLFLGAWVINSSCAVGAVWLMRARAGEIASRVLAIALAAYLLLGGFEHFIDPWNPRMLALPLLLLLVAVAGACAGSPGSFVVALIAASYLAQTHLGLVPLAAVALIAAGVGLWRARRKRPVEHWRAFAFVAVGAFALMWAAPLWQQVTHGTDGNMSAIVEFTVNPPARYKPHSHGLNDSLKIVSARSTTVPFGLVKLSRNTNQRGLFAAALSLLGVGLAIFLRKRSTFLAVLAATTPVGLAVAVLAATRVVGSQQDYLFYWTEALVLPVLAVAGTVAFQAIPARRVVSWATAVVALVLLVVCVRSVANARVTASGDGALGRDIAARIEAEVGSPQQEFRIRALENGVEPGAVFIKLEKDSYKFRVDPDYDLYAGTLDHRANGPTIILWPHLAPPPASAGEHIGRYDTYDLWRER